MSPNKNCIISISFRFTPFRSSWNEVKIIHGEVLSANPGTEFVTRPRRMELVRFRLPRRVFSRPPKSAMGKISQLLRALLSSIENLTRPCWYRNVRLNYQISSNRRPNSRDKKNESAKILSHQKFLNLIGQLKWVCKIAWRDAFETTLGRHREKYNVFNFFFNFFFAQNISSLVRKKRKRKFKQWS